MLSRPTAQDFDPSTAFKEDVRSSPASTKEPEPEGNQASQEADAYDFPASSSDSEGGSVRRAYSAAEGGSSAKRRRISDSGALDLPRLRTSMQDGLARFPRYQQWQCLYQEVFHTLHIHCSHKCQIFLVDWLSDYLS